MRKLLLIDDDERLAELLGRYFEKANVELDSATTPSGGLAQLEKDNIDLVILDIMGVQGFELLETASHRGFPAVMLTAHALNPATLKKSIQLGAKDGSRSSCGQSMERVK